ncbi:hypothetical protein CLU79DRAFT_738485 [Phycomyces nitens]|nr:hypothetical protein CLU79DRAFT_738485 [Phycomyces nitens]
MYIYMCVCIGLHHHFLVHAIVHYACKPHLPKESHHSYYYSQVHITHSLIFRCSFVSSFH